MWYENIDGTYFLKQLYCDLPELDQVRVERVWLMREGTIFRLSFDMPTFPDKLPPKWRSLPYSTIHITVDFFDVITAHIDYETTIEHVSLSNIIIKKIDDLIVLELNGGINGRITAKSGLIQSLEPH